MAGLSKEDKKRKRERENREKATASKVICRFWPALRDLPVPAEGSWPPMVSQLLCFSASHNGNPVAVKPKKEPLSFCGVV